MAWASDNGPAQGKQFFIVGSSLYIEGGVGDGERSLYKRTGDTAWEEKTPAEYSGIECICYWGERFWGIADYRYIVHSSNGDSWTVDLDVTTYSANYIARAMNAYGTELYVVCMDRPGLWETDTHFLRRASGVWTNDVYTNYNIGSITQPYDIIKFGTYTYWSTLIQAEGYLVKRWNPTSSAWEDEPTISTCGVSYFYVHNGVLYAVSYDLGEIWRFTSSWVKDLDLGAFQLPGQLSEGSDGNLWIAADLGATAQLYKRSGGSWATSGDPLTDSMGCGGVQWDSSTWYIGGNASVSRNGPTFDSEMSGGGKPPSSLAVDGDGDLIYAVVYNASNQPMVIRANLPLAAGATGTRIFNPAAGDAGNVVCTEYTGERLVVSGYFGNNEQTELSTNGGTAFTDIDPGTWGTNRAQPVAIDPDNDDHIYLTLDGNNDLVETEDVTTWTTLDAALPWDASALAILDIDPNEIVIGRTDAGASLVQWSPNKGTDWTNITGALPITAGIANIEVV